MCRRESHNPTAYSGTVEKPKIQWNHRHSTLFLLYPNLYLVSSKSHSNFTNRHKPKLLKFFRSPFFHYSTPFRFKPNTIHTKISFLTIGSQKTNSLAPSLFAFKIFFKIKLSRNPLSFLSHLFFRATSLSISIFFPVNSPQKSSLRVLLSKN